MKDGHFSKLALLEKPGNVVILNVPVYAINDVIRGQARGMWINAGTVFGTWDASYSVFLGLGDLACVGLAAAIKTFYTDPKYIQAAQEFVDLESKKGP